jgi:zinc D-Ala-D-Ala carboxypeptidase
MIGKSSQNSWKKLFWISGLMTFLTLFQAFQLKNQIKELKIENQALIQHNLMTEKQLNDCNFYQDFSDKDYFAPSMFDSKDLPGTGKYMKEEFLIKLSRFRFIVGEELYINSAFRTKRHNHRVGGVENSAHTKGYAIDLSAKSQSDRYLLLQAAFLSGFNRIGIGKRFIHLDCANENDYRIWLY